VSQRIQKVNELIKRELAQIILKEIDLEPGVLVTITRVETSNDLRGAKIFISILSEEKIEEVFQILNKEIYDLQQKLNKRLNMRPIPKIRFVEEREVREAAKIEKLLEGVEK